MTTPLDLSALEAAASPLDKIAEALAEQKRLIKEGIPCQMWANGCHDLAVRFASDGCAYCLSHGPKCERCGLDNSALVYWNNRALETEAEVRRLREALEWFADEGHYTGTYRIGAGYADAVGLSIARAALLGMSDDDYDAVDAAWQARAALEGGGK